MNDATPRLDVTTDTIVTGTDTIVGGREAADHDSETGQYVATAGGAPPQDSCGAPFFPHGTAHPG